MKHILGSHVPQDYISPRPLKVALFSIHGSQNVGRGLKERKRDAGNIGWTHNSVLSK
jgi:hypothetical protein